jgi:hypothetical protein
MSRLVIHWTAGAGAPSAEDLESYHILIDRVGLPHRGDHSIRDNLNTIDDDYAAHTRALNTGSIGLALCGMAGANRAPFAPGRFPLTRPQWNNALLAAADLCERYGIAPERNTLLMHCEVPQALGVAQRGKWDVTVRTWAGPPEYASLTPGEELRVRVKKLLEG